MVRNRDVPHLQTARSTTTHIHMKATQATLVAVSGRPAAERMVPATAPMHPKQRVAYHPAGRSSTFDIATISGVSCVRRGSFLRNVHAMLV